MTNCNVSLVNILHCVLLFDSTRSLQSVARRIYSFQLFKVFYTGVVENAVLSIALLQYVEDWRCEFKWDTTILDCFSCVISVLTEIIFFPIGTKLFLSRWNQGMLELNENSRKCRVS